SRCGGVQKVSRPTEMCQEMSQMLPETTQMVAAADVHTIHGTRGAGTRPTASSTLEIAFIKLLSSALSYQLSAESVLQTEKHYGQRRDRGARRANISASLRSQRALR